MRAFEAPGWKLAATALLAAAAAGCGKGAATDETAAPLVNVRLGHVEQRMIENVVTAPGQWKSANEVVLAAPFAAVVETMRPRVGDRVRAGDHIATLVTRESRAAVRGAELMMRQAADSAGRGEARRALELARRDLVRVPLVATASGLVIRRAVEPGADVADGAELFAIVPEHDLVFEAHVPLADASRVVSGHRARIAVEGGPDIAAAVQRRLPTTSAADQAALFWLSPLGPAPPGALDRFGTATIEVAAPRRALAVPDSALVTDDLTGEVRVARVDTTGIAIWTIVHLGTPARGWHELIAPALPAGTALVISGQRGLPDSTRVQAEP